MTKTDWAPYCVGGELFHDVCVCRNDATHYEVMGYRACLCDDCYARAVAEYMATGMLWWKIPF